MLIACLILVSAGIVIHAATWVISVKAVTREYYATMDRWNSFFNQTSADEPSDFNKIINQITDISAEKVRIGVMAADRGQQGAAVRDAARGLEQIAAESDPALMIAQSLPKNLKKNPLAAAGLNMLIQKILSGDNPNMIQKSNGQSSNSGQVKFNF